MMICVMTAAGAINVQTTVQVTGTFLEDTCTKCHQKDWFPSTWKIWEMNVVDDVLLVNFCVVCGYLLCQCSQFGKEWCLLEGGPQCVTRESVAWLLMLRTQDLVGFSSYCMKTWQCIHAIDIIGNTKVEYVFSVLFSILLERQGATNYICLINQETAITDFFAVVL